jgi:hypothetical protein
MWLTPVRHRATMERLDGPAEFSFPFSFFRRVGFHRLPRAKEVIHSEAILQVI